MTKGLAALNERQRFVILALREGRTYADIARARGLFPRSVRVTEQTAVKILLRLAAG